MSLAITGRGHEPRARLKNPVFRGAPLLGTQQSVSRSTSNAPASPYSRRFWESADGVHPSDSIDVVYNLFTLFYSHAEFILQGRVAEMVLFSFDFHFNQNFHSDRDSQGI
jgi:hypothetical protein